MQLARTSKSSCLPRKAAGSWNAELPSRSGESISRDNIHREPQILINNTFKIIVVIFFNFNFNNMVCSIYLEKRKKETKTERHRQRKRRKKERIMKGWSELYFHFKFL